MSGGRTGRFDKPETLGLRFEGILPFPTNESGSCML